MHLRNIFGNFLHDIRPWAVVHHIWRCVLIQVTAKVSDDTPLEWSDVYSRYPSKKAPPGLSLMCGLV